MAKPTAVLFDMDGTLVDVSSIRHLVDPGDPNFGSKREFNRFHEESINMPAHQRVVDAWFESLRAGNVNIVVTARKEKFRYLSRWWLTERDLRPTQQLHRPDKDGRPDVEVKLDMLALLREHYDIVGVWDDNPRVIEMWEAEGLTVHVMPGWPDWGTQQDEAEAMLAAKV